MSTKPYLLHYSHGMPYNPRVPKKPLAKGEFEFGDPKGCIAIFGAVILHLAVLAFSVYLIEKGVKWEYALVLIVLYYPIAYKLTGVKSGQLPEPLDRLADSLSQRLMGPTNPAFPETSGNNDDHGDDELK